ncbi:MAG: MBL fold metallo-hydrolase [Kiritimatiellaeota bacterium]|nr:MBL fold metallo-hydrolase [Kiritimatiellota bacterium]
MKLEFHGAAQTTTGSMHLVEANGLRILLDCGLFQGKRKEAFELNRKMPVNPATLDAVLLSHAHIDHSGNLPSLTRNGFKGKIYCTPPTVDLCDVMLRDSAFLQMRDLHTVNKKRAAQGKRLFELLYGERDVDDVMRHMVPVPLRQPINLGNNVTATFHNAGHILGAALTQIDVRPRTGRTHRLLFSGDLGQPGLPLVPDADHPQGADTLILESTYADRDHPSAADVKEQLLTLVTQTHQARSRLLIPAFSVGRTQQILYYLYQLTQEGRLPPTPVFVDSPLAHKATQIYAKHIGNDDIKAAVLNDSVNPSKFPGLRFVGTPDESKALNDFQGPHVIIAASGMCEGGRVLHHLQRTVGDRASVILIVGYQVADTLGRRIIEKTPRLSILGDTFRLRAQVHAINALSAHADRTALTHWLDGVKSNLTNLFAVHGEPEMVETLCELARARGIRNVTDPAPGQKFDLG